jgi:hypothetical protein
VYARLTPEQQALVRSGKVAVGFDMDSVWLALGEPDRVSIETNASGRHEIWRYVTYGEDQGALHLEGSSTPYSVPGGPYYMATTGFGSLYPGYPGRQWGDLYYRPNTALFVYGSSPERAYELIRVVFDTNGRVAMIRRRNP